jgi:hypothetical protein
MPAKKMKKRCHADNELHRSRLIGAGQRDQTAGYALKNPTEKFNDAGLCA